MSSLLADWRDRPTHRRVWALAAPMMLSNISVPLVALVDSTVIGHLPHAHQLGAVAVGASLYIFLAWMMGFLRMGTTGFAAQAAGREDGTALRQILLQGLLLSVLLSMLLGAIAAPFSSLALSVMQPSAELHALALDFFHIRLLGLPAALASYALVGWFLGTQNARAPLAILLTTNLMNIALNLWFVLGLDWGVAGSARASVIAEWSGALLGLWLTRGALRKYPGTIMWAALRVWHNWQPLLGVNRDIFIRSLMLQLVFFPSPCRAPGWAMPPWRPMPCCSMVCCWLPTRWMAWPTPWRRCAGMPSAPGIATRCAVQWWLRAAGRSWPAQRSRCYSCLAGICLSRCKPTLRACVKLPSSTCRIWRCYR